MICKNCGAENADDSVKCTACGTQWEQERKPASGKSKKGLWIGLILAAVALLLVGAILVSCVAAAVVGGVLVGVVVINRNSAHGVAERYMTYMVDQRADAVLDLIHENMVERICRDQTVTGDREDLEAVLERRMQQMETHNLDWEIEDTEKLTAQDPVYRQYTGMYPELYDMSITEVTAIRIRLEHHEMTEHVVLYMGKVGLKWYVLNPLLL